MQFIILSLIVATGSFEYLQTIGWFPDGASYIQEVLAVIVAGCILVKGARGGFENVHPTYWFAFGGLVLVMVCGIIINAVGSGPVFAGMRTYLRAIPLFFLPAVFQIREKQLRTQLLLVMLLAMLQLPLAIDQRLTTFDQSYFSGDRTVGTMMGSAGLTIFLACVACVLTALYMRKRMRGWVYLVLLSIVLVPTMLNETKATLVLVPFGLLTTMVVGSSPGTRFRNGFVAGVLMTAFITAFVPVYDYFMKPRWGYGIVEFMTMDGRVENYLSKNAGPGARTVGRVDALVVPTEELLKEPSRFAFGFGIGNASLSALGREFTGHYYRRYEPFLLSSASVAMLEVGMLGLGFLVLLLVLVLRDARIVAREDDGLFGALGVGWTGVTVVMLVSLFYSNVIAHSAIWFLFMYFSGLIAAQRMRLGYEARARAPRRVWRRADATG